MIATTTNSTKEVFFFTRVPVVDKYNFFEYISVMVDSGVTITEALASVQEKIKHEYFKKKIAELITYISSGDSFSKAMKKIPQVFESAEISIIEAGEITGTLVIALARLSEELKKSHNLKLKIKNALTYPAIIFLFLFIAVIIVLTYVIPAIQPLFDTSGVELPTATKALIATSEFISGNYLAIILFFITLVVLFSGYKSTPKGKASIESFLLSLPLIGTVYKNYLLASISGMLGSLIGSGINVIQSLSLVGKSSGSVIYESLFDDIIDDVSKGNKIVESMSKVDELGKYFPSDFLQMLSVGESTANLEKISEKINQQYLKEVDYSLSSLTKWVEPIAILVAGVFVVWFAFAILGAILKVTETVA
ncbi:MAG: type II secretion system F family protein [Candidatus Peribacteria bacterium]|nr:MAG: type II secretion system F family protein [Candidatus Peribacteria bacterium]